MKVGVISPIKYLNEFKTDILLCYSTLLVNRKYLEFIKNYSSLVILEYSPTLPRYINLSELENSLKLYNFQYVIMPSIDFSEQKTLALAKVFLKEFKVKYPIGVIQGSSLDDMLSCYKFLRNHCEIIALPSPLEKIARRQEIARDLGIKEKLLWLEVFSDPYEEVPTDNAMGICSSFPWRVTQVNKKLGEFKLPPSTPLVLDFYREDLVEKLARENVSKYMEAVRE